MSSFHEQGNRSEVLDVFSSCYSTLILNYAVLMIEKKDHEGQCQVLSVAIEIAEGSVDVDSKFRALVAVGSLMLEGLVKGIAIDFDVQSVAKIGHDNPKSIQKSSLNRSLDLQGLWATVKSIGSSYTRTKEVRISTKAEGPGPRGVQWHHATCFLRSSPSTQVDKLTGWDKLSVSKQHNLRALNQKGASTVKQERQKVEEHAEQSAKVGTKRKMVAAGDQVPKIPKPEEGVSSSKGASEKHGSKAVQPASDLETMLEAQSKEIWAIKDDLRKHVATSELREMLEANGQDSAGSEFDLRQW
ncbi:hypothetical protein MKW98_006370 [Papaver atlanticum]|uniref:PARP-type domain-containing protein n=1 Tax=Papaver atlanticum TaxID=357466 RepID=A0AAD4X336_9MAGN|nr:hypothetical protein MKW98_006370 [Papaver atlanticum]